ncbi:hypothetical protein MTO96_038505 [Rhipicephalus appendiculatus]
MSSAPSSPHGSGSGSPNSRSGDDVVYAAHFDFDPIATSSSDEVSVEDGANVDANDLGVVVDVAYGLPQWMPKRFAVVKFPLENDIFTVVPLSWLTDGRTKCFWPESIRGAEVLCLAETEQALGTTEGTWSTYAVVSVATSHVVCEEQQGVDIVDVHALREGGCRGHVAEAVVGKGSRMPFCCLGHMDSCSPLLSPP